MPTRDTTRPGRRSGSGAPAGPLDRQLSEAEAGRRRRLVALVVLGVAIAGVTVAIALTVWDGREAPRASTVGAPEDAAATTSAATTTAATTTTAPATTAPSAGDVTSYRYPLQPESAGDYGRAHHDYPATDMFAPCGTVFVAPVAGVIQDVSRTDTWSSEVDDGATRGGLSVSIVGDDGVRYYGSHLESVEAGVEPGLRVAAGRALGRVGETGSARGTGCHLHFGISPPTTAGDWEVRRGAVAPWPYLDSWRDGGQKSPVDEVRGYARGNGPG